MVNRGENQLSFSMLEDAEFYFVCLGFLPVPAEESFRYSGINFGML